MPPTHVVRKSVSLERSSGAIRAYDRTQLEPRAFSCPGPAAPSNALLAWPNETRLRNGRRASHLVTSCDSRVTRIARSIDARFIRLLEGPTRTCHRAPESRAPYSLQVRRRSAMRGSATKWLFFPPRSEKYNRRAFLPLRSQFERCHPTGRCRWAPQRGACRSTLQSNRRPALHQQSPSGLILAAPRRSGERA